MERLNLWEKIQKLPDGEVDPSFIRELKIYKGATGICRDDTGVCISVLNTDKHYPDDILKMEYYITTQIHQKDRSLLISMRQIL